jgi:hypothetical protein
MRGPSARVTINRVDIYNALKSPQADSNGGPVWTYPSVPTFTQVHCTVQAVGLSEGVDAQERVTQFVEWLLMFNANQPVKARDQIIYRDKAGVTHTIFVETLKDNASRGGAFTVRGLEKV